MLLQIGAIGGPDGQPFDDISAVFDGQNTLGAPTEIKVFTTSSGTIVVRGISIEYLSGGENLGGTRSHGDVSGTESGRIPLTIGTDFITGISGRAGELLDHLTITTTKGVFDFGGTGGNLFAIDIPAGFQVVAFWGRSGALINAIGVRVDIIPVQPGGGGSTETGGTAHPPGF